MYHLLHRRNVHILAPEQDAVLLRMHQHVGIAVRVHHFHLCRFLVILQQCGIGKRLERPVQQCCGILNVIILQLAVRILKRRIHCNYKICIFILRCLRNDASSGFAQITCFDALCPFIVVGAVLQRHGICLRPVPGRRIRMIHRIRRFRRK